MVQIPQNTACDDRADIVTSEIIGKLGTSDTVWHYRTGSDRASTPLDIAREVGRRFVAAGYHAKITHFADGRASYQALVVSKRVLDESRGLMVYSDMLG